MRAAALTMISLCIAIVMATEACADPAPQPLTNKRQMIVCMTRSMSANRTVSYNEALRSCKGRLDARSESGIRKDALVANSATEASNLKTP
jgi:hypothetical protein